MHAASVWLYTAALGLSIASLAQATIKYDPSLPLLPPRRLPPRRTSQVHPLLKRGADSQHKITLAGDATAPPPPKPRPQEQTLAELKQRAAGRFPGSFASFFKQEYAPWGRGFVRVPLTLPPIIHHENRSETSESSESSNDRNDNSHGSNNNSNSSRRAGTRDVDDSGPVMGPGWTKTGIMEFNKGWSYLMNLAIGTPPQTVRLCLDTGSNEIWVNPQCHDKVCTENGVYDVSSSNTSALITADFSITYGSGAATGKLYSDVLRLGEFTVPSFSFGVANQSTYTLNSGVLGIAPSTKYYTLVTKLWSLGLTYGPLFSLGLGSQGESLSEIIFGGVDRFKFRGQMVPLPIWPPLSTENPLYQIYSINCTGLGLTMPGGPGLEEATFNLPMVLDTGSTLSYVHPKLVDVIADLLNGTRNSRNEVFVDCALRNKAGSVDFAFNNGQIWINAAFHDFIFELSPTTCYLGIQAVGPDDLFYSLGDSFLRSAYLVFDQQIEAMWLANYYSCGDGVVPVGIQQGDIENVIGQCG